MNKIEVFLRKFYNFWFKDELWKELNRIQDYPFNTLGSTNIFGKPFVFHNGPSFIATYHEIFEQEIYKFNASATRDLIIDCGANMGLSVVYFALNYPKHRIIAFEPDPSLFSLLEKNVTSLELTNVTLHQRAVWKEQAKLEFYTDGGMGGRVNDTYRDSKPVVVEAVPLNQLLNESVDFLKIDIEGAEREVLYSCKNELPFLKYIFFEYHNRIGKDQDLHELLDLVTHAGFHYHIKESATKRRPFVDSLEICEMFDMAINVFCIKE